jgi:outer membrane protein OmpA-like peptidoglycan-associated protein
MKRILFLLTAVMMTLTISAQTVEESSGSDNIYFGINGGVATKATGVKWMNNLNPNVGVRVGRWFTPVFGLAVDGSAYLSNKPYISTGTFVRASNVSLLGTVNLTNWFGGYKGEPRCFEVSAFYGLGWGHLFTSKHDTYEPVNRMTSKAGVDLTFNFGSKKQWQFFIEPSVTWGFLNSFEQPAFQSAYNLSWSSSQPRYNVHNAIVQLNGGFAYKFRNSNGTHNFKLADAPDDSEISRLNGIINELRAELAKKPGEREVVKEVVKEVIKEVPGKEVRVENLVFVTFAQGKSELTREAKAALNDVKAGSHVQVVGTASPEGSAEINQKLSQARADVVADYLRGRGVIIDESTGKGVQGNTSNRLAIVYVK